MSYLPNDINENDVLCGRGGTINSHSGNVRFRNLVVQQKGAYKQANTRYEKMSISNNIVKTIRTMNPPGRFLAEIQGSWVDVGDEKARGKVSQALREKKIYKFQEEQAESSHLHNKKSDVKFPPVTLQTTSHSYAPSWQNDQAPLNGSPVTDARFLPAPVPPARDSFHGEEDLVDHLGSVDSWDQGIVEGQGHQIINPLQDRHLIEPRRALFRERKEEPTCLPSAWRKNLKLPDANALMMESFKSVEVESMDMTSLDMTSSHMQKQVEKSRSEENMAGMKFENFVNTFDISLRLVNDDKMDSTDKLIEDTFMNSIASFDLSHAYKH